MQNLEDTNSKQFVLYMSVDRAILNKSWRQHPPSSSCMATYHPLRKLSKLDEPDMQDTAGEVGTSS